MTNFRIAIGAILILSTAAAAATLDVPAAYSTIQAAVDMAVPGDALVLLAPYVAENVFVHKPVVIIGNPFNPFIETVHGFMGGDTFYVIADGVRIANLRIVDGNGDGIHLDADNCWIGRNIIAWNQWEGIDLWYADGNRIIDNVIHDNDSPGSMS